MDPRHLFLDERLTGLCVYCGAPPDTRDHVPSKVLLDDPYPPQLPVVGACKGCNGSFSLDEEYLACFIECVICGGSKTTLLRRPGIKRILDRNAALQSRIEGSRRSDAADALLWQPEVDRVRKVLLKLARGHVAYELYPKLEKPLEISFAPLQLLGHAARDAFEGFSSAKLGSFPELGTRAFFRAFGKSPDVFEQLGDWIVVQPGRYRYTVIEGDGLLVRIVLSEYLACEVLWEC